MLLKCIRQVGRGDGQERVAGLNEGETSRSALLLLEHTYTHAGRVRDILPGSIRPGSTQRAAAAPLPPAHYRLGLLWPTSTSTSTSTCTSLCIHRQRQLAFWHVGFDGGQTQAATHAQKTHIQAHILTHALTHSGTHTLIYTQQLTHSPSGSHTHLILEQMLSMMMSRSCCI